jgi:hypothetical protein
MNHVVISRVFEYCSPRTLQNCVKVSRKFRTLSIPLIQNYKESNEYILNIQKNIDKYFERISSNYFIAYNDEDIILNDFLDFMINNKNILQTLEMRNYIDENLFDRKVQRVLKFFHHRKRNQFKASFDCGLLYLHNWFIFNTTIECREKVHSKFQKLYIKTELKNLMC